MAVAIGNTKRCPKCEQTKEPSDFCSDKSLKDGLSAWCRVCRLAAYQRWRRANLHRARAIGLRHYYRHRDRILREKAEKRRVDGERIRARERVLYAINRERILARVKISRRLWRALNRDRALLYQRAYYKANSAIWKQGRDRYMARRKAAPGRYTQADVEEILIAQKGRCAYCRKRLTRAECEVDHINSLNKGGTNHRRNIQITCGPCNSKKRDKDPLEFARETGRLL